MISRKKIKVITILTLILVSLICIITFYTRQSNSLEITLLNMQFESSIDNLKQKNICYKVFVHNSSDTPQKYQLVFSREESYIYPYLESIPKEYTTEICDIAGNATEYLEIKDIYESNQDYDTGGFYQNFKIDVKYK